MWSGVSYNEGSRNLSLGFFDISAESRVLRPLPLMECLSSPAVRVFGLWWWMAVTRRKLVVVASSFLLSVNKRVTLGARKKSSTYGIQNSELPPLSLSAGTNFATQLSLRLKNKVSESVILDPQEFHFFPTSPQAIGQLPSWKERSTLGSAFRLYGLQI